MFEIPDIKPEDAHKWQDDDKYNPFDQINTQIDEYFKEHHQEFLNRFIKASKLVLMANGDNQNCGCTYERDEEIQCNFHKVADLLGYEIPHQKEKWHLIPHEFTDHWFTVYTQPIYETIKISEEEAKGTTHYKLNKTRKTGKVIIKRTDSFRCRMCFTYDKTQETTKIVTREEEPKDGTFNITNKKLRNN